MTEQQTEQKPAEEVKSESQELARIKPKQIIEDAEEVAPEAPNIGENAATVEYNERALLAAVRVVLREHGVRKSAAAIRDAVEMPHEVFAPKEAVSALSAVGFKASFGNLSVAKLNSEFSLQSHS